MRRIGEALRFTIATTLVALLPAVVALAEPGESAKPAPGHETESMMNGQPNADATLRNKSGTPGVPVEGADPAMVKNPPKKSDKDMVAKPPPSADKGIEVPGSTPEKAPTVAR